MIKRKWTEEETRKLEEMRFRYSIDVIAQKLGRTHSAVATKLYKNNKLSFRSLTELYTVEDMARMTGTTIRTVYRMIRQGELVPEKTFNSNPKYYFRKSQTEDILKLHKQKVRLTDYEKQQILFMYEVKQMRPSEIAKELEKPHSTIDYVINKKIRRIMHHRAQENA